MIASMLNSTHRRVLLCAAFIILFPAIAIASTGLAGKVTKMKGTVTRQASTGIQQTLSVGDSFSVQDVIETGSKSYVALRFDDDTRFFLGANAAFRVDEYSFGGSEPESLSARVIKGAFRFVTGLVAKGTSRSMRIGTGAVATIGIRGTTVGGEVKGESATIVLLEDDSDTPSAIEVTNEFGSVIVDKKGYGTTVPDAHSPPTPPRRMRLRTIENLMRSLQSIQRMTIPRPRIH